MKDIELHFFFDPAIKPGDTIECRDREDMVDTMVALAKDGIVTKIKDKENYVLIVKEVDQ